jgi:hypothetical protein
VTPQSHSALSSVFWVFVVVHCTAQVIVSVSTDNEDITLLPDNLFMIDLPINLLNPDLQRRIAEDKGLDTDATEALKTLLSKGPNNLQNNLED